VFVDGGGNKKGNCYYGICISRDDHIIYKTGDELPRCETNNEAEYTALLMATSLLRLYIAGDLMDHKEDITIYMDSELVVKQMLGEYKVRAINLAEIYEDARLNLDALRELNQPHKVWLKHIPREENELADQAGREALGK
jgi:ribonuclease HI